MKLTALGKIAIFIIALGIAFGGYNFYQKSTAGKSGKPNSGIKLPELPKFGSNTTPDQPSNTNTEPNVSGSTIQLVSSASKKGWLNDQIDKFNAQSTGARIEPKFIETREAMQQIIAGRIKPALWSPSSVIWADRLSEVLDEKTGSSPLDTGDSNSYRVVLRTPMVFLTTKAKARTLRPLLGNGNCWSNIRAISEGKISVPWGKFRWAHADPLAANSGMLTLALILADYADRTNQSGSIEKVANSGAFIAYLKSLEKRIAYDKAVQKGSSALVQSFAEDNSRYDFITAYESAALAEVVKNPDLAVIYPSPTVNAENSIAFLNWSSLSQEQKDGAKAFLEFVAKKRAAQDGIKEHYRPVRGASLSGELADLAGNGFRESYPAIELPPYTALNTVAYKWRTTVAGQ